MGKKITIEFDEDDAEEILEIIRQLLERKDENGEPRSRTTRHRKNVEESSRDKDD
tara:strand:+ start:123 stop:287 length:165 start_codon:yes stop_codon:yes gene_type:complete